MISLKEDKRGFSKSLDFTRYVARFDHIDRNHEGFAGSGRLRGVKQSEIGFRERTREACPAGFEPATSSSGGNQK
jgi:hypothetical protein